MKTYPICLVGLEQQQAVVVGGGKIAARKIEALLASGAQVLVISPNIDPAIRDLLDCQAITVLQRTYQTGDLHEAAVVIAATNDAATNERVWQDALQKGCLVNVVDDPQHSNFILPAVIRRGEIAIAISTGGSSPALAHILKEKIEAQLEPELDELAALLAELRPYLLERYREEERSQAVQRLLASGIFGILQNQGFVAAKQFALEQFEEFPPRHRSP
jgi:precorrin-2 dehydrogenase/sirohydrochlorin ferrochelatase